MKRKSVLRIGTVLLSFSFMIAGVNASRIVLAEEFTAFENEEEFTSAEMMQEAPGIVEEQKNVEVPEIEETVEDQEFPSETDVEIQLPQESVYMPASQLLPVKEEEETLFLTLSSGLYLLHIKNDSQILYSISFNQVLERTDLSLYCFDSEKNIVVAPEPAQDVMRLEENSSVLSLNLSSGSDYILVISHGEKYPDLGYTSKFSFPQPQETEEESVIEEEAVLSQEIMETPQEEISAEEKSKATEVETETETETETEIETETPTLTSVRLNLDQALETIPAAFLPYLDKLDVYSLSLVYSDGSERLLDKEEEHFDLSVQYEDVNGEEETIHRTYHAVVKELSTGKEFEDTRKIVFYNHPEGQIDDIKPEEMTTVELTGKKNWVMVQAVPSVTGRYSMKSFGKDIKNMYYAADGREVACAEEVLEFEQGITYTFLIEFEP